MLVVIPVVRSFGVSFAVVTSLMVSFVSGMSSAVIFDVVVMVSFFFPVVEFFVFLRVRGECWLKAGNSPSLRS